MDCCSPWPWGVPSLQLLHRRPGRSLLWRQLASGRNCSISIHAFGCIQLLPYCFAGSVLFCTFLAVWLWPSSAERDPSWYHCSPHTSWCFNLWAFALCSGIQLRYKAFNKNIQTTSIIIIKFPNICRWLQPLWPGIWPEPGLLWKWGCPSLPPWECCLPRVPLLEPERLACQPCCESKT